MDMKADGSYRPTEPTMRANAECDRLLENDKTYDDSLQGMGPVYSQYVQETEHVETCEQWRIESYGNC
jgi:hypothetical protein